MPLKPPTPPSSPPLPRPNPHFGDEGTPTAISSRFPQNSSAGSAINPGGPSHPRGPLSLRGSVVGNTGHTDPIPSPLPPKRPGSPELPNDRFKATEQQVQTYDGKKRPDLIDYFADGGSKIQDLRKDSVGNLYFIDEHDHSFRAEFYEDDVTRVMIHDPHRVNDTIFLRLFNDGHYRQVNSWLPEPSSSPQLPLSPHQSAPSPMSPSPSSTIANVGTSSPQSGPSTAPKRPQSPDVAQPFPPKRPRVDGVMNVTDMPPELTHGSGNFWSNKDQATRQLAVNLFRDGKIRDVTYDNDSKGISGKFNYRGSEYRFFYSARTQTMASGSKRAVVTFQDMDGNDTEPRGIKGRHFSDFLRFIEGEASALPEEGIKATDMPPELTHGSGNFWGSKDQATRQSAVNLFQDGKIHDIAYDNGGKGINGKFNYMGSEYRFFYSGRTQTTSSGSRRSEVTFRDMDGNGAEPRGIKGRNFSEFLRLIEGEAPALLIGGATAPASPRLPIMTQNMPGNFSIPNELNPPAAREFWARIGDSNIQFLLTELYKNREIYGINFSKNLSGNPHLNAVMRYQGRDYAFYVGMNHQIAFPSTDIPPVFHNRQSLSEVLYILAGQTLP